MLHPAQTGIKTEASLNYGRDGDEIHPDYQDEQYDKFLSIPFVENDENDEESMLRRMTSSRLSRFVGCGIMLTVVAALATALAYYVKNKDTEVTSDDTPLLVCYENPSCLNVDIYHVYDSNGFTNNTGWGSSSISSNTCCNICLPGMNSTVCFPPAPTSVEAYKDIWSGEDSKKKRGSSLLRNRNKFLGDNDDVADCKDKTGNEDYDYLILDQIYFPQWCNALAAGHDPTLSHLQGTLCTNATVSGPPQLNIHGLWPNYYDGYPQCCKATGKDEVETLDPAEVQTWDAYDNLQSMWYDPTTDQTNNAGSSCATCYLLNHEWEKHGSCYSPEAKEVYFLSGLEIALALTNQSIHIQRMNGTIVETSKIIGMYNHTVNVICDSKDDYVPPTAQWEGDGPRPGDEEIGVFLEIQSCWDAVIESFSEEQLLSVDEEGSLLAGHEMEGATGTLIVDHNRIREGGEGGGVSVTYNVRDWKESVRAQQRSGTKDLATFYGRNCSEAGAGSITKPCDKYVYVGNYHNK